MSDQQVANEIVVVDSDEEVLGFTQRKRREIVGKMMSTEEYLQDAKFINALGGVLDGMDRQTLTRMKIRVEERQVNNQEGMAVNVAEILKQMGSGGHSFQAPQPIVRPIPVLGSEVPDPVLLEGETSTIAVQQDYETFHAKFAPQSAD